jgi:hypothetical protein
MRFPPLEDVTMSLFLPGDSLPIIAYFLGKIMQRKKKNKNLFLLEKKLKRKYDFVL